MTFTKLDDGFYMHPKIVGVGNAATGIFTRMLSYCGQYLTDGMVPSVVVNMIADGDDEALDRLARMGLIIRLESGGAEIPDFLDYNRSKAQVEADRETRRANGSRGGRPRIRHP